MGEDDGVQGDPGVGRNAVLTERDGPVAPVDGRALVRWVLRRQLGRIVAGGLAGTVWMGALAALPVVIGGAIDGAVRGGDRSDVVRWSLLIFGVVAIEAVAGVLRHWCAVTLYIRTRWLCERVLTRRVLDVRGGVAVPPGELVSLAGSDAQRVGAIADLMCRGTGSVVTFIAAGVLLCATSLPLGLLVLLGLPPCMLMLAPLWRPMERRADEVQQRLGSGSEVASDVVQGLRVVKGLGGEASARAWYRETTAGIYESSVALARLAAAWEAIGVLVPTLFLALVLWVAGHQGLDGSLTPGEVVTVTGLALFLATPLTTFAEVGDVWASGLASAQRIAVVIAAPIAVADDGVEALRAGGFDLLEVVHGPLHGVTVRVPEGRWLGIACTEGHAAAALLALAARHHDPSRGAVTAGGVAAPTVALDDWRSMVGTSDGRVPWLAAGTLASNLALGAADAEPRHLLEALLAAGGDDLAHLSGGLDGLVGERGVTLSGGQRQRLALAGALAARPDVLVALDPTTALDAVTEQRALARLLMARAGRTTILITTNPAPLAVCDEVVLVVAGRVVAAGGHDDLLRREPDYRQLVLGSEAVS